MSTNLKIVMTGGGSGGHITPIQAVAAEIKRRHPDSDIIYIGHRGDKLGDIPVADKNIDQVFTVRAGKFRRYHGEGFKQLLDLPTMYKNLRDAFYVIIGIWQSYYLLRKIRPSVIFVKGGFVGVPVGLAAAMLKIPYVTHDSDSIPGLANRIISRWAIKHAVALPKEIYSYPSDKTVTTGIPLQSDFQPVTEELKKSYRKQINIPDTAKLLFVIGGGLGAQRLNAAVAEAIPHLLDEFIDLYVMHVVGRANELAMRKLYDDNLSTTQQGRVKVFGYISDVYKHSGAADIVITRAGATNLAEFALQGRACIIVPSPFLTGGHQIKNARYLADSYSAIVIDESQLIADPGRLSKQVSVLLSDPDSVEQLADNISKLSIPNAASDLADLILNIAGN
jgi:UDP-N-acetylglucosamine--N-acetylmuramyl-(pentapeptide) pyrophosphoryl-undecaprenol N-acetylglucosamine transferase